MFAVVRLTDQILENAAGAGAPPQKRPRLMADLLYKAVCAFLAGAVAEALAAGTGPGPGQLPAGIPGRQSGGGPLPALGMNTA